MPIKLRIVVQVQVKAILAGAVKIAWQGRKGALQIRRAARGVIPGIADMVAARRVERQGIAITIKSTVERHPGIDAVIQSTLDNVGVLRLARGSEHAP